MAADAIIPACTAIETFRDAGYKNTASALAEKGSSRDVIMTHSASDISMWA